MEPTITANTHSPPRGRVLRAAGGTITLFADASRVNRLVGHTNHRGQIGTIIYFVDGHSEFVFHTPEEVQAILEGRDV